MIDLHCHYLPCVDDGARSLPEALSLAAASVENGIVRAVLTPHVFPGQWDNTTETLRDTFDSFKRALKEAAVPLELSLGGEVHLLPEALESAREGRLPTIGEWDASRVVLLELPDSHIPAGTGQAVAFFRSLNYLPMLAHPERNKDVMGDLRRLKRLVDAGCLVQLTAASVIGAFGARAHASAWQLLDAGVVTVIASDAHNLTSRPPRMKEARQAVAARLGEETAERLTYGNPARVLGLPQEDAAPR